MNSDSSTRWCRCDEEEKKDTGGNDESQYANKLAATPEIMTDVVSQPPGGLFRAHLAGVFLARDVGAARGSFRRSTWRNHD